MAVRPRDFALWKTGEPNAEGLPGVRSASNFILLPNVQLAIGLIYLASFVGFAVRGRFEFPYRDDWDWLRVLMTRPFVLPYLFEPHNEHVIPLPRVLFAVQYALEGTTGYLIFAIALATQMVISLVFWRQIRSRWPAQRDMQRFAWGLVAANVFFTYQLQSIVLVAGVLFPLVQMFVILACAAAMSGAWPLAIALTVGAMLTTTNGLIVPFVVAVLVATGPRANRMWIPFALLQAVCIVGYLAVVSDPRNHAPAPVNQAWALTSPATTLSFFLAFFGSAFTYAGSAAGVLAGTACFAVACWALWDVFVGSRGQARPVERFAASLLLFTIISAAMTTVGRAQFGVLQAAQSRYASFTVVFWAALIVWALSRFDVTSLWDRWKRRVMAFTIACTIVGLAAQVFVGVLWVAKADNLKFSAQTLAAGVDDDAWVATLHPETHRVYEARALLTAAGRWDQKDKRLGATTGPLPNVACAGSIRSSPAVPGPGWRIDGNLSARGTEAIVTGNGGTITGVAMRAPLVAVANPMQMDVLVAVRHRLMDGPPLMPKWGGFARADGGRPFLLIVVGDDDRPECQIPVTP
jgi:hypothetical protein